jgi:hypothetical protein
VWKGQKVLAVSEWGKGTGSALNIELELISRDTGWTWCLV